jgi:hypothetical protein
MKRLHLGNQTEHEGVGVERLDVWEAQHIERLQGGPPQLDLAVLLKHETAGLECALQSTQREETLKLDGKEKISQTIQHTILRK